MSLSTFTCTVKSGYTCSLQTYRSVCYIGQLFFFPSIQATRENTYTEGRMFILAMVGVMCLLQLVAIKPCFGLSYTSTYQTSAKVAKGLSLSTWITFPRYTFHMYFTSSFLCKLDAHYPQSHGDVKRETTLLQAPGVCQQHNILLFM